jgi:uncharacterized protein YeeX (DUF496 family)
MYKKDINFSFEYPLSAILLLKNHLRKTLSEIEKHNNYRVLLLSENSNYTKKVVCEDLLSIINQL